MSALIDSIPIPVHVFERNKQGVLVLVQTNSASVTLLGGGVCEGIGCTVAEFFPGRWGTKALEYLENAWKSPEPVNLIHRLPGLPGRRVFNSTLAAQTDAVGKPVRVVVTHQDASLFSEMRSRVVGAQTRNSEMGRTVSLAAHDLRAPMRNIRVISELLRHEFKDLGDGKVELIDMLDQISDKSLVMLTSILNTVSTASREQQQLSIELSAMCEDLRQILDPIGTHDIRCNYVDLYVDDRLLRTVARNLIDNAIKHGQRESLTISINVTSAAMPDMLQMTVSDNGRGFDNPEAVLDASALDTHVNGFGLSTMDNMLSGFGGSINFANGPGEKRGAVVTVVMPGAVSFEAAS